MGPCYPTTRDDRNKTPKTDEAHDASSTNRID